MLEKEKLAAWSRVQGCNAKCPGCGAKCILEGEHKVHDCQNHILPAMSGWMYKKSLKPVLMVCNCSERAKHPVVDLDTNEIRGENWDDYLAKFHPAWLPFQYLPGNNNPVNIELQAAWVHIEKPIALQSRNKNQRKGLIACHPTQWDIHRTPDVLTEEALEEAATIIDAINSDWWKPDGEEAFRQVFVLALENELPEEERLNRIREEIRQSLESTYSSAAKADKVSQALARNAVNRKAKRLLAIWHPDKNKDPLATRIAQFIEEERGRY